MKLPVLVFTAVAALVVVGWLRYAGQSRQSDARDFPSLEELGMRKLHKTNATEPAQANPALPKAGTEDSPALATFGGGCFWCTEAVFEELKGVQSVTSGYAGGSFPNPTYDDICIGITGHAEVIQVEYDPAIISFVELLEVFWQTHDPTTVNRQGRDVGTQYRSVILYHDDQQKEIAENYKSRLDEHGAFDDPIVTEVSRFTEFFPAEEEHQNFYNNNPNQLYCSYVIGPKMEKFRKAFADKVKGYDAGDIAAQADKLVKTDAEWKSILTAEQFYVTRQKGTEPKFTGEFWNHKEEGTYTCVCCDAPLFASETKFKSGTGWPSFWAPVRTGAIAEKEDRSLFSIRTEVLCNRCDAHLGHVFEDGPEPTGLRYCINSAALGFERADDDSSD